MNPPKNISFNCPTCKTQLIIPAQLAGVTGPCPNCQTQIQAPSLPTPTPPPATPIHPLAPAFLPIPYPETQFTPQTKAPLFQAKKLEVPSGDQTILPAEPRLLPARSEPVKQQKRQRPEPSGAFKPRTAGSNSHLRRPHRSKILRLIIPLIFLGLAGGVVYGVKFLLEFDRQTTAGIEETPNNSTTGENKVLPILKEETDETFDSLIRDNQSIGEKDDTASSLTDDNSTSEDTSLVDSGIAALRTLESFLEMTSLEERMPLIESRRDVEELANTILNKPLPKAKIIIDTRETYDLEKLVDHYYAVNFITDEGRIDPQTMLVRVRGDSNPKVVVDPFLDLYGGRFIRYAAQPTIKAETFQVIISVGSVCYDDVPKADKKLPIKIMTREHAKEIAMAYCGKQSKIGRMLRDSTSGISYGQPKSCTIFIRWNTEEDPERPFLEVLDITALDWNTPH